VDAETIRLSVAQELPTGSRFTTVIDYLDRHDIEHSEYIKAGDNQEHLKLLGAPGSITGIIRNARPTAFSTVNIRLVFLFDARGMLISSKVVESVTAM
jgi:hypothetical protein